MTSVRDDPVGASNRDEVRPKAPPPEMTRPERQGGSGVSYAEPKEYEAGTWGLDFKLLLFIFI